MLIMLCFLITNYLGFFQDDKSLEISKPVESPTGTGNTKIEKYDFDFDHVFNHKAGQDTVFDEVSQLIQVS